MKKQFLLMTILCLAASLMRAERTYAAGQDPEVSILENPLDGINIVPDAPVTTTEENDKTNPPLIVNGDMEDDISMELTKAPGSGGWMELTDAAVVGAWRYIGGWNENAATVEQVENGGVNNSRCLSIKALNETTDVMFAQKVTGLKPGRFYKASAKVKTEKIEGGMGANICLGYVSPSSGTLTGTHSEWQDVTLEIDDVPESGEITLCLRLGYCAADSKGIAYFDDVVLEEIPLYIRTSKHFRLAVSKDLDLPVPDQVVDEWLANMDKVYESISELFGGKVPFDGDVITIRSQKGIDAWAYSGNPIKWHQDYISETLRWVQERDDWCFGIMHEIGHDFAPDYFNATHAWNWNEEIFANFRMFYALEKLNAKVSQTTTTVQEDGSLIGEENKIYTGTEIQQFYKSGVDNCYDRTIGAGRAVEMGNALCYCLLRIKEKYGWKLYQDVFEELYSIPRNAEKEDKMNQWERFEYFLSFLTKHAKADRNELFSVQELQVIKSYLSTQMP